MVSVLDVHYARPGNAKVAVVFLPCIVSVSVGLELDRLLRAPPREPPLPSPALPPLESMPESTLPQILVRAVAAPFAVVSLNLKSESVQLAV